MQYDQDTAHENHSNASRFNKSALRKGKKGIRTGTNKHPWKTYNCEQI